MELEGSLPHSQQPAICTYLEINAVRALIPHPEDPFYYYYYYYPPIYTWFFQVVCFPEDSSQNQAGIKITKFKNITVLWDAAVQFA